MKRESTGGTFDFSLVVRGRRRLEEIADRRPDLLDTLRGIEMKQSEEAKQIVADRHADQVRAQIRRIQEEAEMRKPPPSVVSAMSGPPRFPGEQPAGGPSWVT